MYSVKSYFGLLIITLFFSSIISAQPKNWSKFENQKSPYQVYLDVQDENNRITDRTTQKYDSNSGYWYNYSNGSYYYAYYGSYNGLQYYYYYIYDSSGGVVYAYYYYYYYDQDGNLTGYDYYGYYNGDWEHWGTGEYTNHNSNGDWGTETYNNVNSRSGMESSQTDRYFDNSGNVTDEYYSYWNGSSYTNLNWTNTTWNNGYYDTKTYYDWNYASNMWIYSWMYSYYYGNGYSSQVGQAYSWLYNGSPTSWTGYSWYNGAWSPYNHCMYGFNNGYTSSSVMYDTYNSATNTWSDAYAQSYYNYYYGAGKVASPMDISNSRLSLVEEQVPGASAGEWVNSERTWMSYENDGFTTSTNNETSIPHNFSLEQNYPNPFNPKTTINFTLAMDSEVRLSIYDMSGRLINELIRDELNIGNHSVDWNGEDIDGKQVGAGIYIYSIDVNDKTQSKKMMLIK